jgi:hypothetical protein
VPVFRQPIATASPQAPACVLSRIAASFDPADIIPIPLANARNEFGEDPLRNTGRVVGSSFGPGSGSLIWTSATRRSPAACPAAWPVVRRR